jgi:glycosyltransferase involved in cell wall biosynthesis
MTPNFAQGRVDFWSSVECALFLQGLTGALGAHGWAGHHRFEISELEYRGARSRLARLALRWRTYASYPWNLRRSLRNGNKPDVSVVCTNTFYAPRIAQQVARGTPIVHWVFDLFPDVLTLGGSIRVGSARAKLLDRITRSTFEHAAVNVFLGKRLQAHAVSRFGSVPRSVVIPVGCDARPFAGSPPVPRNVDEPTQVLYCGNFGRMHDIDTILQALRTGLPDKLKLSFCGNGTGFRQLERAVHGLNFSSKVSIRGGLKDADWIEAMRSADVALVTMKQGAEGVVMPSKTYSALAAAQAVVAICPDASDLADTIRTYDCGWIVTPGDVNRLNSVFAEIVNRPAELLRRRRNAWNAGQKVFDQRAQAGAWSEVLESALKYKPQR